MRKSGDRVIARDRVIGAHLQQCECPEVPITRSPDHRISRSASTRACGEASFWSTQAPAGVPPPHRAKTARVGDPGPVPHKAGGLRLDMAPACLVEGHKKRIHRRVKARFRKLLHLILATLREIFDENAYERFLQRTDSVRSVESYGAFLREKEAATARKPRCC
jgi:hypothetical protein